MVNGDVVFDLKYLKSFNCGNCALDLDRCD
jgi:hypothetical protein